MKDYIDLLNVGVATLAIALSLFAVIRSGKQQERDGLFRIQEMLLTPDLIAGRRLLYNAQRAGYLPQDEGQYHQALRALSTLNTAAIPMRRKVVPEGWFVESWHHNLRDLRVGYDSIVALRVERGDNWDRWPDLGRLISRAEEYRGRTGCCDGFQLRKEPLILLPRSEGPTSVPSPSPRGENAEDELPR